MSWRQHGRRGRVHALLAIDVPLPPVLGIGGRGMVKRVVLW